MPRNRTRALPVGTVALIAANVGFYALERVSTVAGGDPCAAYGLVPAHFVASSIFTSMFLHDPNTLLHLAGNMFFLAVFGDRVERAIGSVRFALLYILAGIGGALMHVMVDPTACVPMVGASGAIWGVLAAAAMLYGQATLVFIAVFFSTNLWYAFTGTGGTVAFGAHIGGFVAGYLLMHLRYADIATARVRWA